MNSRSGIGAALIVAVIAGLVWADATAAPIPPAPRPQTLERSQHILVVGDSNTHDGRLTGELARLLEDRHGYFGSGYRSIVAEVGNGKDDAYQPYLDIVNHGQWKSVHFIGGVASAVLSPDGTCLQSSSPDDRVEVRFYGSAIDIYYAAHDKGGKFMAEIDGNAAREVATQSTDTAVRRERIDGLTPGWHTLVLRPAGGDAVTLTGVASHAAPPGEPAAVVHKWGRSYAATTHFAGLEPDVWATAVPLVQPDQIVVMLGTNDHMNFIIAAPIMLNNLGELCQRLMHAAPDARLMLVSTVPVSDGLSFSARLRQRYRDALPALATTLGADYWDLTAACGSTNEAWHARGETDDRIHFNLAGARVVAPQLLDALQQAAATPVPAPEVFKLHAPPSPHARPDDLGSLTMWFTADGPLALDDQGRVARWDNTVQLTYLPIPRRVLHARALVPEMRPQWIDNAVGGKPAVRFNGSSTSLALPFDASVAGLAMVVRVNRPGGALFGSSMALYQRFGPGAEGTGQLLDAKAAQLEGTFYLNGRPLPRDGVEVPMGEYVVLSYEGGSSVAIIGANEHYKRYTPGPGDPETLSYLDGDIAELVVWTKLAPKHADQRLRLEKHLGEKYGLSVHHD